MGEFADYALEEVEEYENHCQGFWRGEVSPSEAFDRGLIDERGFMPSPHSGSTKKELKCRCCGSASVKWGQHEGKWRLFDGDSLHICPVNPLAQRKENLS